MTSLNLCDLAQEDYLLTVVALTVPYCYSAETGAWPGSFVPLIFCHTHSGMLHLPGKAMTEISASYL